MPLPNSPAETAGDDSRGPEAVPGAPSAVPADTDDAIFAAFKVAKAAGDLDRARVLLELLAPKAPDAGGVTPLTLVRGKEQRG